MGLVQQFSFQAPRVVESPQAQPVGVQGFGTSLEPCVSFSLPWQDFRYGQSAGKMREVECEEVYVEVGSVNICMLFKSQLCLGAKIRVKSSSAK